MRVAVGATLQLVATASFYGTALTEDVSERTNWSVVLSGVVGISTATGSKGLLTGIAGGSGLVTADFDGFVDQVMVTVP